MRRTIVLGCSVLFAVAAGCGGDSKPGGTGGTGGTGGASAGGRGGSSTGGTAGANPGGTGGASTAGTGGAAPGGTGGSTTGGTGGSTTGGTGGASTGGTGGATGGTGGASSGGTGGTSTGGAGAGGRGGTGGSGGTGGTGGSGGTGGGGPRTVTLASADGLAFVAGQDGDGAWRVLDALPSMNTVYTLQVTGARYGLAYGCASAAGDAITLTVVQATVSETTRVTVACGGLSTATPVTITGTVGGLADAQPVRVHIAGVAQQVTGTTSAPATYMLTVPMGTWDLFALRMTTPPLFDRMLRRNSVILTGPTTVNLDFASEGFAPEMRTVTLQGLSATETPGLIVNFRNTAGGTAFGGSFPTGNYLAVPAAQLRTGDYHSVVATATEPGGGTGRNVRRTYTAAMSFTAVMPPMITPPVIAVGATTPYVRPRGGIPAGLDSDRYDLGYSQGDTSATRQRKWALQLTRGWIAAAGASDYTVPDLSGVAGFQVWWGLTAGEAVYQQFANWTNAGVADLLRADQTAAELDGHEYKTTQRNGLVTF